MSYTAPPVRQGWLDRTREAVLEPERRIIDAHHHVWDRPGGRYLFDELLADLTCGHDIHKTVYVECKAMYHQDADADLASLGDTEFANGIAAMFASNRYGPTRACAGIVANVNLQLGADAEAVLDAHACRAGGRLKGVRSISAFHPSPEFQGAPFQPPPGLLLDRRFQQGFSLLSKRRLTFDAWLYHSQLPEFLALAKRFPETVIILDHVGGPLGIGPFKGRREEVFSDWSAMIRQVAACSNVHIKLSGLGMHIAGFDFHRRALPPSSQELADAWQPYISICIEVFGPKRCMFASNFPVDKGATSYAVLWNAYKRLAAEYTAEEKQWLFCRTAAEAYSL